MEENYLLTAFELLHELLDDGRDAQAIRLMEFFSDPSRFPPDQISRFLGKPAMDADGETMATRRTREEIDIEAEANRKEVLLASTPSLQPYFNRSNVTQKQISKLQELHKRRMHIKANSKIHKKPKANNKSQSTTIVDGESSKELKEPTPSSSSYTLEEQHRNKTIVTVPKKSQKLYWGLDTRERWERKSNM